MGVSRSGSDSTIPALPSDLRYTASVGTDDGDSVRHRLNRDQRLALAPREGIRQTLVTPQKRRGSGVLAMRLTLP